MLDDSKYFNQLAVRIIKLNCIGTLFSTIVSAIKIDLSEKLRWSKEDNRLESLTILNEKSFFKNLYTRRYALVEIDVIVAMAMGLELGDLIEVYNIQFPISKKFESDTWYDINGNIVFTPSSKTLKGVGVDRPVWETIRNLKAGETYEHTIEKSELYYGKKVTYHAPFEKCDRVGNATNVIDLALIHHLKRK